MTKADKGKESNSFGQSEKRTRQKALCPSDKEKHAKIEDFMKKLQKNFASYKKKPYLCKRLEETV